MDAFKIATMKMLSDEDGAALVEYGMLVGLIAVICVAAVTTLGTKISNAFQSVVTSLSASGM